MLATIPQIKSSSSSKGRVSGNITVVHNSKVKVKRGGLTFLVKAQLITFRNTYILVQQLSQLLYMNADFF